MFAESCILLGTQNALHPKNERMCLQRITRVEESDVDHYLFSEQLARIDGASPHACNLSLALIKVKICCYRKRSVKRAAQDQGQILTSLSASAFLGKYDGSRLWELPELMYLASAGVPEM